MIAKKPMDHGAPEPLASFLIYIESIQGKSAKTADEYFYDIRTFYRFLNLYRGNTDSEIEDFEQIPIDNISVEMLRAVDLKTLYEYMNFLNRTRGNSAVSRSRKISSLRSYYKYLSTKIHVIDENPAAELDSVKFTRQLPKHFTLEDSVALLNAVESRNALRDYCILTLFLNCGMRLTELVNINISDIRGDTLVVVGKGNKERTIYLNDACQKAIDAYLPVRKQQKANISDKNALFLSERNNRISQRTVQYTVEKYVKKIGLDPRKYTTHKLRHTAATLMHQAGVDIRVLQEILGHKQLSTTEIYTHINNDQMREAVRSNPLSSLSAPPSDADSDENSN